MLCEKFDYRIEVVTTFFDCIPYVDLTTVELKSGESLTMAPATDYYGGAAVALSMDSAMVAAGRKRNTEKLDHLSKCIQCEWKIPDGCFGRRFRG